VTSKCLEAKAVLRHKVHSAISTCSQTTHLNREGRTKNNSLEQGVPLIFHFADFEIDVARRELRREKLVPIEPQVLDLLIYLVQNHNRVVSKDDIIAAVWDGRSVSDGALTSRVYAARKAIGDSGHDQRLIRTIARKGFRFVGTVRAGSNGAELAQTHPENPHLSLPLPERPAIAVLPFVNMSGDPEQECFSDGISEDITTALSKLRWFFVIARNTSFTYKGQTAHIRRIGEELGVGYVLEGSVRRGGDRVRISAQLDDVATGSPIWAERYDRSLADVFAVQDEITGAIVASVEPQLYVAENFRARRKTPDSLDAWNLVMQALSHFWRVTREDNFVAQALLEKAIAIDPNYGQAHGVLAASHVFCAYVGWTDMAATVPIAERAALASLSADSEDPWAHHALGCVDLLKRRFDDSLAEFEIALSLNPNFALAQSIYGLALIFCGRREEGAEAAGRALRLSPRDPFSAIYNANSSFAQFVGRNYDEAISLARAAIRLRGDHVGGHRMLAAAAAMAGRADLATTALQELRRTQANFSIAWIVDNMPFKRDADREHYLEAFRCAGLN
jgi:TolB-like protein